MDFYSTLVITILSAILGYLFSVWRNRLRPWVALLKFGESRKASDKTSASKLFCEATGASWFVSPIEEEDIDIGTLHSAMTTAKRWVAMNKETEVKLKAGIELLEAASNPDEVSHAINYILGDSGLDNLTEAAVLRNAVSPNFSPDDQEMIRYYLEDKKFEGCYTIVFKTRLLYIGSKFNSNKYRIDDLLPLVKLISRLDKENLLKLFKDLVPINKKQFDIHTTIVKEAENIVKAHSHWDCELTITNFGATPFILFPDTAKLIIQGKHIKPFSLDCRILSENKENKENPWEEIQGVAVLKSGSSDKYSVMTKKVQKEIEGGNVIRGVFESGEAQAYIELEVLGRELPWKHKVKSLSLRFKDSTSET